MSKKIDIENGRYWDEPWSLVDGCTPCSPGCDHCWSAAMTHRFENHCVSDRHPQLGPFILTEATSGRFTGKIITHPDRLSIPLKRRKPTVFSIWNDLFHEAVPTRFVDEAIEIIFSCTNHKFLILTKRPERMSEYFNSLSELVHEPLKMFESPRKFWPFENVHLGLTVCNQEEADVKIPIFLQVPGKKFLSIEPMLGPIDLCNVTDCLCHCDGCLNMSPNTRIDAVILGGETGPGARPMNPDWVRSVRDQCAAAGVPFFFKQWGKWLCSTQMVQGTHRDTGVYCWPWEKSGDTTMMVGVVHPCAGRLLDDRTHDDLPWVTR